jgi:16S rRNA processing protein RimM
MMDDRFSELLEVGVVAGTHGLRGDLRIRPLPTGDLALPGAVTVYLAGDDGTPVRYSAVRSSLHKQHILLRLKGLESLAAVEPLVGASVWMAKAELPELDEGHFFWSDLEGASVIDRRRGLLGQVTGMFATAAHEVIEVEGSAGETLIPAIQPFLLELDRDQRRLLVDLPDGLAAGDDES